jgi:hypothetical protein
MIVPESYLVLCDGCFRPHLSTVSTAPYLDVGAIDGVLNPGICLQIEAGVTAMQTLHDQTAADSTL